MALRLGWRLFPRRRRRASLRTGRATTGRSPPSAIRRLTEINTKNYRQAQAVLCTYDTQQHTSFEFGLIMVNGSLIGTTFADIFSIDPATCAENWRTREDFGPAKFCQPIGELPTLDGSAVPRGLRRPRVGL